MCWSSPNQQMGGKAGKATLELQVLGLGLMEVVQGTNLLMNPLNLSLW